MKKTILVLFLPLIFACNSYNKLLKSESQELKLAKAMEYYETKDYYRTIQLLESIISSYRGTAEAEKIYYYYAYSHFNMGDYMAAAYHFNNLYTTLPNSKYAEESLYMSAYCNYMNSPSYNLDQTNTKGAIAEMQKFINKYPQSEKVKDANRIIDEMREKLEFKAFSNAKLFFNLGDYKASITSLNNVIREFPGTKFTEEATFLIMKSWLLYATGSVQTKKAERFEKVKEVYEQFALEFPESKFQIEAKNLYNLAIKNIEKLSNTK